MSTIEIRCDNVAGYNEASQGYDVCNQKIRVNSQQIGKRVICPKCKQPILVHQRESTGRASQGQDGEPELGNLNQKRGVMDMDFQATTQLRGQASYQGKRRRCAKCAGAYSDDGVCQACGYVEPVQAARRRHEAKKKDRPAGFQLWLRTLGAEGVSVEMLGIGMFVLLLMFCVVVIGWGVLSTTIIGSAIAAMSAFLLIFICMAFHSTRKIAVDNNAGLGVLAPFWELVLFLARSSDWQRYDPQLKGRKIIDLRKKPIVDDDLQSLPGLGECQVLDLENSEVTDAGLKHLYPHTQLRCLVLKNTDVSREAVTMLQQHRPKLWIWM